MKKLSVVAALLLSLVASNATCIKVEDNIVKATLSGRYIKHYSRPLTKEEKQEDMFYWNGASLLQVTVMIFMSIIINMSLLSGNFVDGIA